MHTCIGLHLLCSQVSYFSFPAVFMCAGCAEGDVSAVELQWPYEGSLPDRFPLGFAGTTRCQPQSWRDKRWECSTASSMCIQEMLDCAHEWAVSLQDWIVARNARWEAVEALRTVFAASIVPCVVFACVLLASTPLLAKAGRICDISRALQLQPRAQTEPPSDAAPAGAHVSLAQRLASRFASGIHATREGVLRAAEAAPWAGWSGRQRQAAQALLLRAVAPMALLVTLALAAAVLLGASALRMWQLDSCLQHIFNIPGRPGAPTLAL